MGNSPDSAFDLKDFEITADEKVFLGAVLGWEINATNDPELIDAAQRYATYDPHADFVTDEALDLAKRIAEFAITKPSDEFAGAILEVLDNVETLSATSPRLVELVLAGLKQGITSQCGASANNLGAMYYMGHFVEQDYAIAAGLYETAADWGDYQGLINLGYIYEYGRTGKKDMQRAYECYALSAAMTQHFEALYKLGDMYSRGFAGKKDMKRAVKLWQQSYHVAETTRQEAQAAIRLAPIFLSSEAENVGLEIDPMAALVLFQKAEVGMRMEIMDGATYYAKRLEEAIKGQDDARMLLDLKLTH